ncbi:MAG: DUF4139 domain-containing protein [Bacteroidota bacterium]
MIPKSYILFCLSILLVFSAKAEVPLETKINKVKVYLSGAQVSRTGETYLNAGEHTLTLTGLSPFMDAASLKVSAKGQFTVLSITHSVNYLKPNAQSALQLMLQAKIDSLTEVEASLNGDLEIIREKKKVLDTNRKIGSEEGVSISQLREALAFYENELAGMKRKELKIRNELKELEKLKKKYQNQLSAGQPEEKATSEIEILVKVNKGTKASFGISYLVANAGWKPKYDVKVSDLSKAATLTCKASFFQNTQEDWDKVALSFSSIDPKEGALKPEINPWYLSFAYDRVYSNRYKKEKAYALEEVVVSKRAQGLAMDREEAEMDSYEDEASTILPSSTTQKATSVEFEVNLPYTLKSEGGMKTVDLEEYEIPASYQYYAVPKLNQAAFLVAQITDWESYNLLDGEINLFFEDTYVGKSMLNTEVLTDTMEVSLGKDNQISISREKIKQFSKTKVLGTNRTDKKGFEISLRNNKPVPVTIKLQDQVPLSTNSSIEVKVLDTGKGSFNEATGIIDWEIKLKPGESKKLNFSYEVKYPKGRRVVLE